MLKHFYILVASTFLIGVLSGAFIYFISKGPVEPEDRDVLEEGEFEIVVDMYGGCNMLGGCASYKVRGDGEYTYVERRRGQEEVRHEGALTDGQLDTVLGLLDRTDLSEIEASVFNGTCPIAYDGLAYRYEIIYSETYSLDSCEQDTEDVLLFDTLNEYFEILRP